MPRPKKQTRPTWTDHAGKNWRVPMIKDRLRCHQIAGHAALKAHVICRDGGRCLQCGASDDLVLDHIISRRNGGTHHPDNLQALCKPCNDAKSNYQDRGKQPTACGQLSFRGLACTRTAGHSGFHSSVLEAAGLPL
jgi:5-methylcytosine-specific restriction endonuclease McrA